MQKQLTKLKKHTRTATEVHMILYGFRPQNILSMS